ncbi:phosphoprotein phosphatase [Hysterangium stoloniferum]|nr:phosphoprotein phosphatase [Hysterangium stoloniferum]
MPKLAEDTTVDLQFKKLSLTKRKERMFRPSASYLAKTAAPSQHISTPQSCKKLIILDLNGTLLFRPRAKSRGRRQVLLRPYIPVLRSFIFHDVVKPWLDVMIWSSAQPQNVKYMANKCFETGLDMGSSDFKAIWARDTLGLPQRDYNRKVGTVVKDLEKPWAAFQHSTETTVLVDDSLSKARLQPYNHICVPEYTNELIVQDRAVWKGRSDKSERCDSTLLAVIGILDEMKSQSNVASWIRAGGLWAGRGPASEERRSLSSSESDTKKSEVSVLVGQPSSPGNATDVQASSSWFEHQPCFSYWVERGTSIAASLDIQLDPGEYWRV